MTKEKAIEYVNTQLDKAVDDADFMDDEMYETLQVLVKIAEQEPKTGRWVDGKCSVCGENPLDYIECMGASNDAYTETPMLYCPNCGAKMEREETNADSN